MSNPQAIIQFSDDHGHTWSHEIWVPLVGDSKNYLSRIRLHRQGRAYQRIYRITFTEDAPFTLISMHGRVTAAI